MIQHAFVFSLLVSALAIGQGVTTPQESLASVEGDVYLLNRGGDVKPGAANEIALLRIDNVLREKWKALCESQAESFRARHVIRDSIEKTLKSPQEKLDFIDATLKWMGESVAENRRERAALLKSNAVALSPTGMKAHYEFRNVAAGEYWLFGEMSLGDMPYWWLHRLTLKSGESQRIDLDNTRVLPNILNCDDRLP